MSGKNIIFGDKKINKVNFTSKFYKNKKLSKIDDIGVNKILISEKEACGKKSLNTSLDIMSLDMMSLDHYV